MCKMPCTRFAKSHIVPRGFSTGNNGRAMLLSFCSNGDGRTLQDGIYDSTILCPECEERLKKYDTRACEVLRQCKNARMVNVFKDHSLIVFPKFTILDRLLLRGFLASLLWRMSVTKQKEFFTVNIGKQYEDRIAEDILNDGSFSYVDALVARYDSLLNFRIETPQRDRIKGINVYWVKLPFLNMIVSLDKRKNPCVGKCSLPLCGITTVSTSLSETEENLPFGIAVMPAAVGNFQDCTKIVASYNINRQAFLQSNRKQPYSERHKRPKS